MKLLAAILVLLPALASQSEDEKRVRELNDRLVDDDINVREKAASDLAEFGKVAVPALERLRSSGDVELRSRAASILRSIGENEVVGRHWHRGVRITLEADRVPVAKVLDDLQTQARDKFKFDASELKEPMSVRVKDAPFWEALDAVCRAAPALTWEIEGDLLAFKPQRRPPHPVKRSAEFQVWLDTVTFSREYDFTGQPRSTFVLNVASAWEAGIAPVAVEQKVTEILDEDGTNLLQPDRFFYGPRMDVVRGRMRKDMVTLPVLPGAKTAKRFSRVRGASTFYFPRAYEQVSVDLRATAAPVVLDRVTVAVRNFRALKDSCACEVVVTSALGSGSEGMVDRLPFSEISILDDQGGTQKAKTSSRSHSYSGTSYTIHENLTVPMPEGRTPATLRLRILKDVLEKRVPFEFDNIALE